jgi:carbonic anhydrase
LLRKLTQARESDLDQGWNLIVLQHTDCGIVRLQSQPEMLANYLNTNAESLAAQRVGDPTAAVELDVAGLRAAPAIPRGLRISGFSTTGRQDKSKQSTRDESNN